MKRKEVVIPVVHETATVTKRQVDRGSVRVSKLVSEHEEQIDTSTIEDEIVIEHVARNTWLKKPQKARVEGDTVIIPIMEEVTVVEKRLILREEIYVRRKKVTKPATETVRLRREEIRVEDNRKHKPR